MTHHPVRRLIGSIALLLACSTFAMQAQACCHRSAAQRQEQTYLQLLPVQERERASATVGEGEHAYRFVVRDVRHPSKPWRRGAYQITVRDGETWVGGPNAHQGVTDAQGRTAIVRSKSPVDPGDWRVLPLLGRGPNGMTFRLVDQDDNGVADHPYLIDAERGGVYCGRSLPSGDTARVLTAEKTNLRLYSNIDEGECNRLAAAVNPVMADAHPQRQIKGLQRLVSKGWSRSSQERLNSKLMDVLLVHGNEGEIRAVVSNWMAEPGVSRQTLADRLNSAGYGLVDQQPPRLMALAESLLAQGRALEATPAIVDSHAWSLHALGRHDEALAEIDASIEGFQRMCSSDHEGMYQETLAHRAQVLADLGRSDEALQAWVRVYRLNQQATWASSVPRWSEVSEAVQQEARRQEGDGVAVPAGCADSRDQRFLSGELAMPAAFR